MSTKLPNVNLGLEDEDEVFSQLKSVGQGIADRSQVRDQVQVLGPLADTKTVRQERPATQKGVRSARDSFSMPFDDYALIEETRARGRLLFDGRRDVSKSTVLRAGLRLVSQLNDDDLRKLLEQLPEDRGGQRRMK